MWSSCAIVLLVRCCCCCLFYRAYKLNFAILLLRVNNNNSQQPTHIHSKHNKIIPEEYTFVLAESLLFLCFQRFIFFCFFCSLSFFFRSKDDKLWINWSVFICNLYFHGNKRKHTRNKERKKNDGIMVLFHEPKQSECIFIFTINQDVRGYTTLETLIIYLQLYILFLWLLHLHLRIIRTISFIILLYICGSLKARLIFQNIKNLFKLLFSSYFVTLQRVFQCLVFFYFLILLLFRKTIWENGKLFFKVFLQMINYRKTFYTVDILCFFFFSLCF